MAGINKYDVPAQDTYIDTYVDLPYAELMSTIGARQAQLDKAQDMLSKTYEDTQNLRYIPGTKNEEYVKDYISNVNSLVDKYYTSDMTNPIVKQQLRREFNNITDKTKLQNIQTNYANWMANNQIRQKQIAEGTYSPYLDEDPANNPEFGTNDEIYNFTTPRFESYIPEAQSFWSNVKPSILKDPKTGEYIHTPEGYNIEGYDETSNRAYAESNWGTFAETPTGRAWIKHELGARGLEDTDVNRQEIATELLLNMQPTGTSLTGSRLPVKGKDNEGSFSYDPLLVVEGPDRNISSAKKENKMYKADISEAYSIENDVANLSAVLKTMEPGSIDYYTTMAMINDLNDRKNNITSTIDYVENEISSEYVERKNEIMSDFIKISNEKGISKEDAMAAFNAAMNDFGDKTAVGMGISSAIKNPKEETKKFGFANYNRAKLAVSELNKINNKINKKVKEAYPELAQKRVHDNMYLLSGTGIGFNDTSPNYIGKDGRQTVSATSKVLGELRNQGAAFSRVLDITPGKADDRFEKIEDMTTHIKNSDYLSLSKVSPSISPNGDYKFIVNTNNEKDGNKSIKTFEIVLNKYTQPKITQSFLDAFASDLTQNGNYTEALRLQDPELEIEFKAKKNDEESIIVPDKSKPDEYIRISKVGDNQYNIIDPEGRSNTNPISYDDVVMQLYGWRVRDKYYKD